jgi:AcrR family transcriptional regulator
MPRIGLDAEAVVSAAAELADADGLGQLTLARLADRLGVRAPSLYVHVDGLPDLRRRLAIRGARQLEACLASTAAGLAGEDALRAVAVTFRDYARAHPGTYAALQQPTGAAPGNADGDAARALVDVVAAVLRGYGLQGDDAMHAVRVVRAALHGFVSLEADGGFGMPLDIDESFERLIAVLHRGLAA